ncbi:exopolysaccharide biosynthesis polyprenyl glycosylphosphotransferase [Pontibacter fetidus]|uniref:Exopolysaccharide biosynthesis polyprenyl glycosylphosphotransferase n=1 Tax=Pontibacter fetidus TaxID=2700082 RepID=A0A6B2H5N3_9BACT|nr:exopolysaccharide biosynthesis polyprenyl glycosylphosphotransferase [Pontibacter fetidus]NDK55597.1 exopolysaccharide biosynthesis polyprenyl glycosylphosphotransferase [Pontibacter fetidus]
MTKHWQRVSVILIGGEILSLNLIVFFVIYYVNENIQKSNIWLLFIGFILFWILFSYWRKVSAINFREGSPLSNVLSKAYIILMCFATFLYLFHPAIVPQINLIMATVLGLPAIAIPVSFLAITAVNYIKTYEPEKKHTLIAGVGNLALNVEKSLSNREIQGYIKCKNEECQVGKDKIVGELAGIYDYLKKNPVDEIVIAIPVKPSKKIRNIVKAADYYGIRVKYVPDYQNLFGTSVKTKRYGSIETVNVRQLPLDGSLPSSLKNGFDKLFAFIAIILLMPLFLVLAILIKADSPGPVFYCPIRIGKAGKPFRVIKFRTMSVSDDPAGGTMSTQSNDPRVTKIGKLLRAYSLDELPQFFNVLIGNMSVVGPRPHRSYLNEQLQKSEEKYMIRHYYKPGITGWAQVNGWRGPTETKEQKSQRTRHDIWYMENWSFLLDLKIILLTIFSSKTRKNAF